MIIEIWKMRLDSYENDYKDSIIDYATEVIMFIILAILTPIILIFDLSLLPIYLIAYVLKNKNRK